MLLVPLAVATRPVVATSDGTPAPPPVTTVEACGPPFLNPVLVADEPTVAALAAGNGGSGAALARLLADGVARPTAALVGSRIRTPSASRASASSSQKKAPLRFSAPPPLAPAHYCVISGGNNGESASALPPAPAASSSIQYEPPVEQLLELVHTSLRSDSGFLIPGVGRRARTTTASHQTPDSAAHLAAAAAAATMGLNHDQRTFVAMTAASRPSLPSPSPSPPSCDSAEAHAGALGAAPSCSTTLLLEGLPGADVPRRFWVPRPRACFSPTAAAAAAAAAALAASHRRRRRRRSEHSQLDHPGLWRL